VAVLAPTTILVEQHLHTFAERLAGFPVRVAAFSRLRTPAEQKAALLDLVEGRIDVAIGTHRMLSSDVQFKELGLLVVDEEQRFGVRHKERLKDLRRTVDVLTLTATPIPRTLQLALGGLRDLSLIETAPRDRMPVITHVLPWSDSVIQDAIRREMDRAGQVFFVHDRIETIEALAQRVRRLAPEARLAVAHGRMKERDLEDTMAALMDREIDILVSTSIIENGLDVPTANTMIVHRSDRFGLAQLYQLRGRVGRSHHRAYCYLLVPEGVTPEAVQRLRILEHHTELGSGYRVALKDLQLRGAGNLLGSNQSGFAQAVGFDTYQRLLERQVRRMKGGEEESAVPAPQVDVEGEAFLPDEYIAGADQKMNLYRRISRLESTAELDALEEELRDRFGPIPQAANRLLASVRLRLLGTALAVERIHVSETNARVSFRAGSIPRLAELSDAFADRQIAVEVRRLEPVSLVFASVGREPMLPLFVASLTLWADSRLRAEDNI
jgi:transcription-repair coupling factor (superfamily II helicase)